MDGGGGVDRVMELVRRTAMAALPNDADRNECHRRHETARADADIALVVVWNVVEPVDLVDAIEAAFFDHWLGAARALLRRLVEDANCLVGGKLLLVSDQNLHHAGDGCHVPVVAAHMRKLGLSFVFEVWVVFRHRQCVHVGSKCQSFYSLTRGRP